ncbi:PPC domain-containing DNA-binding protein [uncultured Azohydromonas sp.]|jgi:Predicted DNA-binding protein with PD1-like DNA-binding motif|uniref:PPC domain-containing DNA-binding protein n=1 Tax=uncultured Azohydromonas sp. TaxID=487342 RepID=UPI002637BC28|nr:DUF296 domain-containing protein [uncultured Azohydromonas sp.]
MQSKLLNQAPERTFALVFERGDELVSLLERFAAEQGLEASRITAIGAFEDATLGYFDWERKEYERIPVREQVEVLSLVQGKVVLRSSSVVDAESTSGCPQFRVPAPVSQDGRSGLAPAPALV